MEDEKRREIEKEFNAFALDACQTIFDTSMFWDSRLEKQYPGLRRARTMAAKALEANRRLKKEDVY